MTLKIRKNYLYGLIGMIAVLIIGGVVIAARTTRTRIPAARPYAGVKGTDLPTVVGQPSLGGAKIPFTETANYKEYTPEVLAAALSGGKATLLYFYADWCGSCRGQEPINQAFMVNALAHNLPLNGIRVNVDENQPLMRQYGINYQHSYVLLDKTGKPVDKFFGEHSAEELKQKVQQVL